MQNYPEIYQREPLNFPENLTSLISNTRRKIKPRFKLLPADWADANFTLPESSAKKGKWVTAEVEYTRRILNAIADPMVNEITVMTSSQILKTTMMLILITYVTDYDTSPILVLLPTISQGENFSKTKLESVIENIDILKEKIGERKSRDKRNTIMYKELPGGNFIIIVGANSPVGLAMHSIKYVFEDDIDRIPVTAGEEGDPCALAEQRTESFKLYGYKVIRFSTPTTAGRSRIEAKYKQGSREKFYVPCPHCGFMQVLRFFPLKDKDNDEWYGGLTWDKDKDLLGKTIKHHPQTARYVCEGCRKPIYEKDKDYMRRNGEWIAENPDSIKHLSFGELGRLYSSLSTWVQIVELWLDYKDDPELIKVFNNTVEGKVYVEDETAQIDQDAIMEYVEDYLTESNPFLPNEVLFLTGAVDVHPDRLEVEIDGWGFGEENFMVHYVQLWGDPDQAEVWQELDELKERKWKRKDGVELMIGGFVGRRRYYAIVIDSGGYRKNTQSVYNYTRAHQHNGIISIKGRSGQGYPILLNQSMVGKNKDTLLQNVGIDSVKKTIWNRLKYKPGGPRTFHYTYAFCDYKYFEGLFSEPPFTYVEKRTMTYITIFKKRHSGIRNEPWDLKGYNYVAMLLANLNFTELKENLLKQKNKNKEETVTTEKKKLKMKRMPVRGNFINSWKG